MMNKRQADKFATLYHFLKNDVPNRNFDLHTIARCDSVQELQEHRCGSAACVCGWMPAVFPRTFKLNLDMSFGEWYITSKYGDDFVGQFASFFGVTSDEAEDITVPGNTPGNDDSRKGVLNRMKALAGEYGWEI